MSELAKREFIEWVKVNDPFLYNVAVEREKMKSGVGGIGDFFGGLVDTIKQVAPSLIQYQGQKKILDVQVARARSGLPPLESTSYVPTVPVQVSADPESIRNAQQVAAQSVKEGAEKLKPYFFGALVIAAFLFFKKRR